MKRKHKIALAVAGVALLGVTAWLWYWYGYGARLAAMAQSDDPHVRLEAIALLRGKSNSLARKVFFRLSNDPDVRVAREAVRAVGTDLSQSNYRLLREMLNAGNPVVRGEAAAALGKYEETDVQLLLDVLQDDPAPAARAGAGKALGRKRDPTTLTDLTRALKQENSQQVRIAVITAIHDITIVRFKYDPGASPAVRDRQASTIESILRTRGLVKDYQTMSKQALLEVLRNDQDSAARAGAAQALARRGDPAVLPELVQALRDRSAQVRSSAIAAVNMLAEAHLEFYVGAPSSVRAKQISVIESNLKDRGLLK